MTDGCKGCAYLVSVAGNGSGLLYCDYAGKAGRTRKSLGVITDPGGGCSLKVEGTHRRKPVPIAFGKNVEPPKPKRKDLVFGKALKEKQNRLSPAEHQRRLEMYHAGYSDTAIARASGVRAGTIWEWRKNYGLPTKYLRGRPKKTERKETT